MPTVYQSDLTFVARGAHPTLSGTPINVSGGDATRLNSINADAPAFTLSGTNHAGVLEWRIPSAASLTIPGGQVVNKLSATLVGRFSTGPTFTTDPQWTCELYDSRTSAVIGASKQALVLSVGGTLVGSVAGGVDAWGLPQATLLEVMAANALRVRFISPGWQASSPGSLVIDGVSFQVESGAPAASKRQYVAHRRTTVPARRPSKADIGPGELVLNLSDMRLYAGDGASNALDLTPIRHFSVDTKYAQDEIALYGGRLYWATPAEGVGPGPRDDADWAEVAPILAPDAAQLGGLTKQQWYDITHPVLMPRPFLGTVADLHSHNLLLAACGISANWQPCMGANGAPDWRGYMIGVVGEDGQAGQGAGSYSGVTEANGSHNHGGSTADHTLTRAEMPADALVDASLTASSGATQGGSNRGIDKTFGGGQAHHHGVNTEPPHEHAFAIDPLRVLLHWIVRVA